MIDYNKNIYICESGHITLSIEKPDVCPVCKSKKLFLKGSQILTKECV